MTQDEKLQAYEAALKKIAAMNGKTWSMSTGDTVFDHQKVARQALAAFEPEPEMEYVLPEWAEFIKNEITADGTQSSPHVCLDFVEKIWINNRQYNALRELTKVPKPEQGREWWLNLDINIFYATKQNKENMLLVREVIGEQP